MILPGILGRGHNAVLLVLLVLLGILGALRGGPLGIIVALSPRAVLLTIFTYSPGEPALDMRASICYSQVYWSLYSRHVCSTVFRV